MKLLRDTFLIYQRQVLLLWRNPVWVFVGVFQPVAYLLLFGPLLEPALAGKLGVNSAADAYQIFVPGLLVMLAIFGGLFQGFGLIAALRAGVIERSRVTPVSRLALLLGRSLRDVTTTVVQAGIITALALLFGLRAHLLHVLLAFVMLGLISLMTSAISYGVALKVRSEDVLAPVMNTIAIPVFLLSGILLPISREFGAPAWLVNAAKINPFSWAVNGVRALFVGDLTDPAVWQGLVVTSALAVLAVLWAARAFARSVR